MVRANWTILFSLFIVTLFTGVTKAQLDTEKEKATSIADNSNSEVNRGNETDYCAEICGKNNGVICKGDKKWRYTITCSCSHEVEDFDSFEKECIINYCKLKCGNASCLGDKHEESSVRCLCLKEFEDFDKRKRRCKVNYCKKVCGTAENIICSGDEYEIKEPKDCQCVDKEYVFYNKTCRKKCFDNDDCRNEGTCSSDYKTCQCKDGTTGDMCEIIRDCSKITFMHCRGDNGECVFKNGKAQCQCPEGKKFYEKIGRCEEHCNNDTDCKGYNRICNAEKFCVCPDGYEGKDCDQITGCILLDRTCRSIGARCIFDKDTPEKASCKCKAGYIYDRDTRECKHTYCHPSNPCKDGECLYNEEFSTEYCKCFYDRYYDYKNDKCKDLPDKCLLNKFPCTEDEICVNRECKCKHKVEKGDECKPKLCTPNPCFRNARCSEYDGTCYCAAGMYYFGRRCEDAGCNLKEFKKKCPCPSGTRRTEVDGECAPLRGLEGCSKDCGYGECILVNYKETCKCYSFAALSWRVYFADKCVLNRSLCASEKLQRGEMKCDCEGQYTQADDGVTCRLKTCEDDDAKMDCASKGADCKMNWKGKGYYCECPKDYAMNEKGKCADPCSQAKNIEKCAKKDLFCYISPSNVSEKSMTCDCPPTFRMENGKCTREAKYVYLISNIPVLKKKYDMQCDINKILLSADLMQSMESTFSADLYDYGYLYDYDLDEDVVNCSVWINFKKDPHIELERMRMVSKDLGRVVIWPPNLFLTGKGLQQVKFRKLSFCSSEVKDLLCGKDASCFYRRCECREGFKIVENSIREIGDYKIRRCEDIDECATGIANCPENTFCVNTIGDYKCACKEGFKKAKSSRYDPETDKSNCYDMCTPSPCRQGSCSLKGKTFTCHCPPGYGGSYCEREDAHYFQAKKITVIWMTVGIILGVLLLIVTVTFICYKRKIRKQAVCGDSVVAPPTVDVNKNVEKENSVCGKDIHPILYPHMELSECQVAVAPSEGE